jgi:hypothetical protein
VLSACIVIPMVEELAYRGYLMRRLASADFMSVGFHDVRRMALNKPEPGPAPALRRPGFFVGVISARSLRVVLRQR